jgi:hypothetical protein
LLGYSDLFIFTCFWLKILLRIMCSFKTSTREEGKNKLKKDKKLLEVSIIISARCVFILTKMLAIMEKFIKNMCVRIVLWRGEGVFQDFTCRWVCWIYISNIIALNKLIKKTLVWMM